ncbi:hypothetical protein HOD08_02830 [bacterium]|jgi:Skp family chaperone for outer membrane proteins|nr:hypothetical protein [bacterium]
MKKIAAISALLASTATMANAPKAPAVAKKSEVTQYISMGHLLESSKQGKKVLAKRDKAIGNLQELAKKENEAVAKIETEFSGMQQNSKEAVNKAADLEYAKRQASLKMEKEKAKLEVELKGMEQTLFVSVKNATEKTAKQENWAVVKTSDAPDVLYVSEALVEEATNKVVETMNKEYMEELAKSDLKA